MNEAQCAPCTTSLSKPTSIWDRSERTLRKDIAAQEDPWEKSRVDWVKVVLNLFTYVLLVSDVPRAGTVARLDMRSLGGSVYSYFGSYAYEVVTFTRDPVNPSNITATSWGAPIDMLHVWSYTFDTTSIGMRTITNEFSDDDSSHLLSCMSYRIPCDAAALVDVSEVFTVLDRIVGAVKRLPESLVPAIYPPSPDHSYQFLRRASFVKSRHSHIFYDKLMEWTLPSVQKRLMHISHWPQVDQSFDVCADVRDRPLLCDEGTFADYRNTADPIDTSVSFIWVSMNEQVQAIYDQFHNATKNVTIDVTILEGYTDPLLYLGGVVLIQRSEFEIVILTRVRDCSKQYPQDTSNDDGPCRTIRLVDFRYEGGFITTDLDDWRHLVTLLRIIGQVYYIIRVVSLFFACYFAFPPKNRSWRRSVFLFLSEIPSHVVTFGSMIPVTLYTLALYIDGTAFSAYVHSGSLGFDGNSLKDPMRIYKVMCVLMRRQWLLAFLTMLWVRLQVMGSEFNRHNGIVSVRGHIFGIISAMSMVFGYYHPNFRDTRIVEMTQTHPALSVLNAAKFSLELVNRRYSGFYADLVSLAVCAAVYSVVAAILYLTMSLFSTIQAKSGASVTDQPKVEVIPSGGAASVREKPTHARSFFFVRTVLLPSTFNTLWGVEGLMCGWDYDVFLSMAGEKVVDLTCECSQRNMLMNIVQLSEPWNYFRIHMGLNPQPVRTYVDDKSTRKFSVVGKWNDDPTFQRQVQDRNASFKGTREAKDLAFHELVRCP